MADRVLQMVRRTMEMQLGDATSNVLIGQICGQMGIDPAALNRDHMDMFSGHVYAATEDHLGAHRARFLAGTLQRFSGKVTQEVRTNEPQTEDQIEKQIEDEGGSEFTFARFCISQDNKLAYESCAEILEQPRGGLLFLHGPVGCGKTHLLRAVAHRARNNSYFNYRCRSMSCQDLKSSYLDAVKSGSIESFRNNLMVDILLIDDLQFLVGQAELQEELFSLFQAIMGAGGRIILTSDRPPGELAGLSDRLRGHVSSGHVVIIGYPDLETRVSVLGILAKDRGWVVPPDVMTAIAERCAGNLRELKGSLTKVVAYAFMAKKLPSPAMVAETLG